MVTSGQGVVSSSSQGGAEKVLGVDGDVPVNDLPEDIIEHHIPLHRLQIYIPPPVIIVLPPPPSDLEIISNVLNIMVAQIAGEEPIAQIGRSCRERVSSPV